MKSVIIKDKEGTVLIHVKEREGEYTAYMRDDLGVRVTVVTESGERVRLR